MTRSRIGAALGAACLTMTLASAASAQVLGTFNWQMQPYCHRVVLTLTGVTGTFTLDGFDDQCGASSRASAIGVGTFTATGDLTLNFTIVTPPAGRPVHVSAVVSTANGHGTWSDSVGNTGTFVMGGAVPGLPARPLPASGLAPGTITAVDIAADAVGASKIAAGAVGQSELASGAVRAAHLGSITTRIGSIPVAPGGISYATAGCLAGEKVLSGGVRLNLSLVVVGSIKSGGGWTVAVRNESNASVTATAEVYCLAP